MRSKFLALFLSAPTATAAMAKRALTPHWSNKLDCNFFLLKTEPKDCSIDDIASAPDQTVPWDGVRNHQAKGILKSAQVGDLCFVYHSSAGKFTGLTGVVVVVKEGYPDVSALIPGTVNYDPKIDPEGPAEKQWLCIDVKLVEKFSIPLLLSQLNEHRETNPVIDGLDMFKQTRLSCSRVTKPQFEELARLIQSNEGPVPAVKNPSKKSKSKHDE